MTFVQILRQRAMYEPDRVAFTFVRSDEDSGESVTYGELYSRALAACVHLARVQKGGRVLLLFLPGVDFIVALLGCWFARLIAVPTYVPSSRRRIGRLEAIQQDAKCGIALASNDVVTKFRRSFRDSSVLRNLEFTLLEAKGRDVTSEMPCIASPKDIAFLQYTSGTTGGAKGVIVSHENLIANSLALSEAFGYNRDSHCFSWLPPYHDMGLVGCILQPIHGGFPCTMMSPAAFTQKPERWLDGISRSGATLSGAPDFAYDLCVRKVSDEARARLDLSRWKVAFSGAEPVRLSTLEAFSKRFASAGFESSAFLPCYGLAESTLFVTGHRLGAPLHTERVATDRLERNELVKADESQRSDVFVGCGSGAKEQEVQIVDPATRLPVTDSIGEIWVRSSSTAQGYWRQESATEESFHARLAIDGSAEYLRTGDLGFISDGDLFISGRLKELIILRGRNHYPLALEETVAKSLAIDTQSVAVFSAFERGEERLLVAVETMRSKGEIAPNDLELARRKVSEDHEASVWRFVFVPERGIPRTTSGKKRRNALAVMYAQGGFAPAGGELGDSFRASDTKDRLSTGDSSRVESLRSIVARCASIPLDHVSPNVPISSLGLDSLAAAEAAGEAEVLLGRQLSALDFIGDSTIADIAASSASEIDCRSRDSARDGVFALSPGQHAILAATEASQNATGLNLAHAFRIDGEVDRMRVQSAIQQVFDRHEALRTRCLRVGKSTVQSGMRDVRPTLVETSVLTSEEAEKRIAESAWSRFDRMHDCPIRAELILVSPGESYLLIAIDHLFADLTSLTLVIEEFKAAYRNGDLRDHPPETPYSGYIEFLQDALGGAKGKQLVENWRSWLRAPVAEVHLPFERQPLDSRPKLREAGFVQFTVNEDVTRKLKALAKLTGSTLFTLLLAALGVAFRSFGNSGRVGVAIPMHGRPSKRFSRTVGYFINLVPVILDLRGPMTFRDCIADTRSALRFAMENQYLPLEDIVSVVGELHGPNTASLTDVMATIYRQGSAGYHAAAALLAKVNFDCDLPGFRNCPIQKHLTQFHLAAHFVDSDQNVAVTLEYDRERFRQSEVELIGAELRETLKTLAEAPAAGLADVSILAPEHRSVIQAVNNTATTYSGPALLHELFIAQAQKTPEREALVFGNVRVSYGELDRYSSRLAKRLRSVGVKSDDIVAVFMERSIELVIGLLGILKAGACYLPLATDYPMDRLSQVLADARPRVTLTQGDLLARLPKNVGLTLLVETGSEEKCRDEELEHPVLPDNLAYVIYTSGSTGAPKGAMNTHRGICNRLQWMQGRYVLLEGDRVLQKTPYTFDVSVWEFFWPLISGATLVVAPPGAHKDSRQLCQIISEEQITTIHFVPSLLQEFLHEADLSGCRQLKRIICSGEALTPKIQQACLDRLTAELHNLYGPTEAAVDATAWHCAGEDDVPVVSIGTPIANMKVLILDEHGRPCPLGVVGELYLGGVGLARGYWNRPSLTAERFMPHPDASLSGERLYRTGDLARWRSEGNIEFIGRSDGQVKIRGHRIELAEVEFALLRHSNVRNCSVILLTAHDGESSLCAFVVLNEQTNIAVSELRAHLRSLLPEWMIPPRFVLLDSLPLSSNGKLDRKALKMPAKGSEFGPAIAEERRSPAEEFVAKLWSDILHVPNIPIDANFFDMGGHSLSILRLRGRLEERLGISIPFRVLIDSPTIPRTITNLLTQLIREDVTGQALDILGEIEQITDLELQNQLEPARGLFNLA